MQTMSMDCSALENCKTRGRETHSVVSDLEGSLLYHNNVFSYFMLVAFEASGLVRFALVLFSWPVYAFFYYFVSETVGIKVLIFVTLAGLRVSEIESVARAVLCKFYMEELNCDTWRVFCSFGRRVVVTSSPRVMVESFAKRHLQAQEVIGTEIEVSRYGRATGFVKVPGVLVGARKRIAVKAVFGDAAPTVGIGRQIGFERSFMALCKENYTVPVNERQHTTIPADDMSPKPPPIIFHDGRLVQRPTPLTSLFILLYIPFGIILALTRIFAGFVMPMWVIHHTSFVLGTKIIVKGKPPPASVSKPPAGVLFVCTHRTLLDPVILSIVLKRRIPAVTYSISRLSEILSPIPTVRLSRNRDRDGFNIRQLLQKGDLAVCPEGTTCREPFLLRFSSLFAELADQIVPVAMNYRVGLFHGTTARGWKAMDPFFFYMNPRPIYEVTFLKQLPWELTCSAGRSAHEVANYVQKILADTLGYECTNLTRRDKYSILAGNDGTVSSASSRASSSFSSKALKLRRVLGLLGKCKET